MSVCGSPSRADSAATWWSCPRSRRRRRGCAEVAWTVPRQRLHARHHEEEPRCAALHRGTPKVYATARNPKRVDLLGVEVRASGRRTRITAEE